MAVSRTPFETRVGKSEEAIEVRKFSNMKAGFSTTQCLKPACFTISLTAVLLVQ